MIENTTFDDILYYRLLVWNIIGDCVSNTLYLNVTGSMCSHVTCMYSFTFHFSCTWLSFVFAILFFVDSPNITCSHETCFESRSVKLIAKVYLYETCHEIEESVWTVNNEKIHEQGLGGKFSIAGVNSPCLTIHNVTRCDAGSYKLTASNAVGSTISDAIELSIPVIYSIKLSRYKDEKIN